jgi:hypothetical protein
MGLNGQNHSSTGDERLGRVVNTPVSYSGGRWAQISAPATAYNNWGFSLFSSVHPGECRNSILSTKSFPIHNHSPITI